ncbi:MAG: DUF192 domain-containing protein [Actinomycetota bacterium]|nr:DUF192 domain-containing protein [Actinomycetota bacterium]
MKRSVTVLLTALGLLLATTALTLAQSGGSSSVGDSSAAEPEASQLPALTIINSVGERVPVQVEIADTDAERQQGLMGRTALAEDAGMLFVFDQEQQLSFWMKDTSIPLSIAFINGEGRIVDIQDMQPFDETPHLSAEPARYALEVNQGFFEERGVMIGDKVELPGQSEEQSGAPPEAPTEISDEAVPEQASGE